MLIDKLLKNILRVSDGKDISIVGISGLDASGKSQMGKLLHEKLGDLGIRSYYISGDIFHFDEALKYSGSDENGGEKHMNFSINHAKLRDEFLIPLKQKNTYIPVETRCFDTGTILKGFNVEYPCVYIIESIYLFRSDLIEYFDYKIFLEISEETCLDRCYKRERDHELYGDNQKIKEKYENYNFPGYRLFMEKYKPKLQADIVINNDDYLNPKIISRTL